MSLFYGHCCYKDSHTGIMIVVYQQYLHENESNGIKVDDNIDFLHSWSSGVISEEVPTRYFL